MLGGVEIARRRWHWVGLVAIWMAACGGAAGTPVVVPQTAAPPVLPDVSLALPEGARWILIAEPSRAMSTPALRRVFDVLFPERRRVAWSARYAVDPTTVERVAVGEYVDGVLLVVHGGLDAPKAVTATSAAMDAVETASESPSPRTVGLVGSERYLLAAAAGDTLVLGEGAPRSWQRLMQYIDGDLPALGSPALEAAKMRHATDTQQAPIVLHLLAPLQLPPDTPVGVIMAGEEQLSLAISSSDVETITVWLALSGEFPETIVENLRSLITAIAAEPLGMALGIADALPGLEIKSEDGHVVVRARLPTERVVQGLETLFGADLWHLLDVP